MSSHLLKNEEDTKLKIVFNYLTSLGFDESELYFEESFFLKVGRYTVKVDSGEEIRTLQPRLDILISRAEKNLCIVEVKDGSVEIGAEDIDQAVSYGRLVHPIAPICIVTNGKDWKLVNTITKNEITNESLPHMEYEPSLPNDAYYEALEHFLGYSEQNLRSFCTEQVSSYMEPLKGSPEDRDKKFIPQMFEARPDLQKKLEEFIASDSNFFAVVGDSGRGKTCWICDSALHFLQDGNAVFFYRGSDIDNGLFQALSEDLNWTFSAHVDQVEGIRRLLGLFKHKGILLFIDGLDELESANARRVVDTFLRRAEGKSIKLIATCKAPAWESLLEFDGIPTVLSSRVFGSRAGYDLSTGFDAPEFSRVVMKYRSFYGYVGGFESNVIEACKRDPLLLRVVFEVAAQENMPYVGYSTMAFYRHYLNHVFRRFGPDKDRLQRYLINIAKCFFDHNGDELDLDELLRDLNVPLHESLPPDFFTLNILERHERDGSTYVRFYLERLRDYIIAFRAFKWQTRSASTFSSVVESLEMHSVHLDVLKLYYSLASAEHKRIIDGSVYDSARMYVQTYQDLLDDHFKTFKEKFLPYTTGRIGFLGGLDIPQRTISWHSVRPIPDTGESITLLPSGKGTLFPADDNAAYLRGALQRTWNSRAKGFTDPDAVRELAWEDVRSSLEEIIEQGQLNESKNTMLLTERIIAISFSAYKDYYLSAENSLSCLPIALDTLREFALNKLNFQVLASEYLDERIARGQAQETWQGDIVISTVGLPPDILAELDTQAKDAARRREDLLLRHSQVTVAPAARILLHDIDSLEQLGITQIENSPLTDWYAAQLGRRVFFVDSQAIGELERVLPYLYQTFIDEYKTLVEVNFPLLCKDFEYYRALPKQAWVAMDVEDTDRSRLTLAHLPVKILEYTNNSLSSSRVALSSIDEINEVKNKVRADSSLGQLPITVQNTGRLMLPIQCYLPNKGLDIRVNVDSHFCPLRSLVYETVKHDAKVALSSLQPTE